MKATNRVLAESKGSRLAGLSPMANGDSELGSGVGSQYLMVRFSSFANRTQGPTFAATIGDGDENDPYLPRLHSPSWSAAEMMISSFSSNRP